MAWSDIFLKVLKDNNVWLVAYVPDNALTPLINGMHDKLLDRRFDSGGPMLLAVKIDDKPGPIQAPRDPTTIRIAFMKGMGTSRGGGLEG